MNVTSRSMNGLESFRKNSGLLLQSLSFYLTPSLLEMYRGINLFKSTTWVIPLNYSFTISCYMANLIILLFQLSTLLLESSNGVLALVCMGVLMRMKWFRCSPRLVFIGRMLGSCGFSYWVCLSRNHPCHGFDIKIHRCTLCIYAGRISTLA
jgi:hypothetical protein